MFYLFNLSDATMDCSAEYQSTELKHSRLKRKEEKGRWVVCVFFFFFFWGGNGGGGIRQSCIDLLPL